jgi:hypothetical protein
MNFVHNPVSNIIHRIIINDCPNAAGVESGHKFRMCRHPRNVRQTIVYFFLVGGAGRIYKILQRNATSLLVTLLRLPGENVL